MSDEVPPRIRVLFVDDDPLVLQGLQRMLRSMRTAWDMEFVDGGAKALDLLKQRSFEVVVSDMRMPGMNGAQLLNALAVQYPDTIRIILSGHADQDLITQCLGSAHQYLSKPCDPDLLKKLVNDTWRLGSDIASERVRKAVGSLENLPSLPATYRRLSEALAREDSTAADLGRIISQDIGMTAKILKLVNSAFFGLRRELSNPTEAVTYLGTETVRSLVLANGIFQEARPLRTRQISLDDIWNHSLAVGHGARNILRALKAPEAMQNDGFISGLLQDTGILILAQNFPDAYDQALGLVQDEHYLLSLAEQRVLGVNHAEVGAYLTGLWGLPALIVQSLRFHHSPALGPGGADQITPAAAVHLADVFCAQTPVHPAFGGLVLDPGLAQQPWLKDRLEALQAAMP